MPKFVPKSLSLSVDGKNVELHHDNANAFELNKALTNPSNFKQFAANPQTFAAQYGLKIDPHISDQLKGKLHGVNSLTDLVQMSGDDGSVGATVWAVAGGAYSISSSKIAVAF